MTCQVPLTQGQFALIDEQDADLILPHRWFALRDGHTYYANRKSPTVDGKRTRIHMHRVILDAPVGMDVDHRDGDGLNNTRENLRLCSRSQNMMNQRLKGGTSQFKGVHWRKKCAKWQARIQINGKRISLGHFIDEIEAARAYDTAARELFGEFSRTNFGA